MAFEYGACPCAGGEYEARLVEVRMRARGSKAGDEAIVVLRDVPQGVCLACGSRVYKAEVLARIEAVMMGETVDPVFAEAVFGPAVQRRAERAARSDTPGPTFPGPRPV
jgi:hypothetical protein